MYFLLLDMLLLLLIDLFEGQGYSCPDLYFLWPVWDGIVIIWAIVSFSKWVCICNGFEQRHTFLVVFSKVILLTVSQGKFCLVAMGISVDRRLSPDLPRGMVNLIGWSSRRWWSKAPSERFLAITTLLLHWLSPMSHEWPRHEGLSLQTQSRAQARTGVAIKTDSITSWGLTNRWTATLFDDRNNLSKTQLYLAVAAEYK